MAWYDTGTVSVTNGSTTVTGSGTNFIAGAQVGEAFYGPDDSLYEIVSITSATALVLADAYLGSTQTGQQYKIVPTQSLVADLTSQVSSLISDFQSVKDEAGEGKFDDGTAASAGITFNLDQNTGFFRPANNQIGFATAGGQRALITSTGLNSTVIGATTPAAGTFTTGTFSNDAEINGLTVGKGGGNVSNNTANGVQALANNTTGVNNTANGFQALQNNTEGNNNTAVGREVLEANTTGLDNTANGVQALQNNTTGSNNTANGVQALLNNTTGSENTAVGYRALFNSTGDENTAVGRGSGNLITTGSNNTILGRYSGNQGGLDITTANNFIVLSDGTGNPRQVIDSSGRVGIGETSPAAPLHVNSGTTNVTALFESEDLTASLYLVDSSTTGGTSAVQGLVTAGNELSVRAISSLAFRTGGTQRVTINSAGALLVGKTASNTSVDGFEAQAGGTIGASKSGGIVAVINRNTNDGTLIALRQGGETEGSISVSGTTVSFNGGHLARWSQTADNIRIAGLVKGTVLTNLDEMAVWSHEAVAATYYVDGDEIPEGSAVGDEKTPAKAAYTEENEQLNCLAVSSVEGDPNVAGVFVNWDDDDDQHTADMNIAMTGDMIIRIAQGTTVQRGDLLMSAGDGTAKPQGDDIVRSKTIAKVTSTHVSNTYDDRTYCVPCVLMAC